MRTRNIAIPAENKVPTKLGVCQSVSFCNHSAPGALPHGFFPEPLPRAEIPFLPNRLFVFDE